MFRIAAGEELGFDDPVVDGHSIEFRINAEDGGNNFMPAPGTLSRWEPPSGPGVRVDGGYVAGETIPGAFDSLIAKVIVTGRDRTQALERSRRALAEFVVDGMPTVVPFHRAVVDDPAYIGVGSDTDGHFGVYTSWIETEFDNQITPYAGTTAEGAGARGAAHRRRRGGWPPARGLAARRARLGRCHRRGPGREEGQARLRQEGRRRSER